MAKPNDSRRYILTDPDGNEFETNDIRTFCDEHNLWPSNLRKVAKGQKKTAQGWKARFADSSDKEEFNSTTKKDTEARVEVYNQIWSFIYFKVPDNVEGEQELLEVATESEGGVELLVMINDDSDEVLLYSSLDEKITRSDFLDELLGAHVPARFIDDLFSKYYLAALPMCAMDQSEEPLEEFVFDNGGETLLTRDDEEANGKEGSVGIIYAGNTDVEVRVYEDEVSVNGGDKYPVDAIRGNYDETTVGAVIWYQSR